MTLLEKVSKILGVSDCDNRVEMLPASAITLEATKVYLQVPFLDPHWNEQLVLKTQSKIAALGLSLTIETDIPAFQTQKSTASVPGVKNIIAISSGKGGVGKSTVTVNLALALVKLGAKVGILDADIYGPSMPIMLGQAEARPGSHDGKTMEPITAHGVVANSIGFLVPKDDATVWRGPMASKALSQIIRETQWGQLDYLIVDMPPGTGDIQLTMSQQVPLTAAVVVTTPQNIALADASKGISMFEKVSIPVLGVIENMSSHVCNQCGHEEAIFSSGGGQTLASERTLPCLAQLPLHIQYRQDTDNGLPTVSAEPESVLSQHYLSLASRLTVEMAKTLHAQPQVIAVKQL
ncbi:iron-sulfur cluster carrier protein ApbC [Motilimonas pumila]|uniref:Iron-sulfur cluster carrier protein n=1 Tax=Motilimonas pumila TaxID=2303987 RepID=A0A418YCH7_9GAMM|nr:iron-sulfur cluster carrier protein ApbC [Motilimonas pumila]RJG42237.1 iron-sulfur cluster carrier protein ApbC [Motilimonas pumila]